MVTMVSTKHRRKIRDQNTEGQSPPQELEVLLVQDRIEKVIFCRFFQNVNLNLYSKKEFFSFYQNVFFSKLKI